MHSTSTDVLQYLQKKSDEALWSDEYIEQAQMQYNLYRILVMKFYGVKNTLKKHRSNKKFASFEAVKNAL